MRKIFISLLATARTSRATRVESTVSELLQKLCQFQTREEKDGGCWSPIIWKNNARAAENFESACALVYDLDWDKFPSVDEKISALSQRLEETDILHAVHQTVSSENRLRLIIPLGRDITAAEYQPALSQCADFLRLNDFDPSGVDLARLFYLPSKRPGTERAGSYGGSKFFELFDGAVNVEALRIALKTRGCENALGALSGKPVPAGERHNTALKIAGEIVDAFPPARNRAQAEGIFRLLLQSFDGGATDGAVDDAMRAWQLAMSKHAQREILQKTLLNTPKADSSDWRSALHLDKNGQPKTSIDNLLTMLESCDGYRDNIRYNELTRRIEISPNSPLFLKNSEGGNAFSATLDVQMVRCAEREMGVSYQIKTAASALLHHARLNSFNPVTEYLNSLQWDGVPRIDTALERYAGVTGDEKYITKISKNFFVGAVARALQPGCKLDTVLILQGAQGLKKTSFVEVLGGPFFNTFHGQIGSTDSVRQATESWFVELSELASMSKTSVETLRGFITQTHDFIRLPYATSFENFKRRCVFVGTTNDESPLNDSEGTRRYWVVSVGEINIEAVKSDRDQLFAEAVHSFKLYLQDESDGVPPDARRSRWWLTPDEQKKSDRENSLFYNNDAFEVDMAAWAQAAEEDEISEKYTSREIATKILRIPIDRALTDRGMLIRVAKAARRLGWRKIKVNGFYKFAPHKPRDNDIETH